MSFAASSQPGCSDEIEASHFRDEWQHAPQDRGARGKGPRHAAEERAGLNGDGQRELERALLSAIFKGAPVAAVDAEIFVDPVNRAVFDACRWVVSQGAAPSPALLFIPFVQANPSRAATAMTELNEIDALVPTSAGFALYLDRARAALSLRKRTALAARVSNAEVPIEEIRAELCAIERLAASGGASVGREILDARRFDATRPPPPSVPVFSVNGITIATAGNLVALGAQAKAGKTALVGCFIAAAIGGTGDMLGITSTNPDCGAVVHFDTEQSRNDHFALVQTSLRRAGLESAPAWLRSYSLADRPDDRWALLVEELDAARRECGRIHCVLLDAATDYVDDVNDAALAPVVVRRIHALAIEFNTAILCVLHFNPGSDSQKYRGHFGSELLRKAESNLSVERDGEISVFWADKNRHAPIAKDNGPRFRWSDQAGMHVSTASVFSEKLDQQKAEMRDLAHAVFKPNEFEPMPWGALVSALQKELGITRSGATKRFERLKKAGAVVRGPFGDWMLGT